MIIISTARNVFDFLAEEVARTLVLKSPLRSYTLAASLAQVSELAQDLPLTIADASVGYAALSYMRNECESISTYERREVCLKLARIASGMCAICGDTTHGSITRFRTVITAVVVKLHSIDERLSICDIDTLTREVEELSDYYKKYKL